MPVTLDAESVAGTYWFDASDDGELIDRNTAQQRIRDGNAKVHHFGSLLLREDFPYEKGDFPPLAAEGVGRKECVKLGKIAVAAMAEVAEEPAPLTFPILGRLYILGLGIYPHT